MSGSANIGAGAPPPEGEAPPGTVTRGFVHFPSELEPVLVQSVRHLGRTYPTRVVHVLPDGRLVTWTSRRHRKGRGLSVTGSAEPVRGRSRGRVSLWGVRPTQAAWWIAFIFTVGSVLFVAGALPQMFPAVRASGGAMIAVNAIFFAGSFCFTVASYVQVVEAANVNLDQSVEIRLRRLVGAVEGDAGRAAEERRRIRLFGWHPDRIAWRASVAQFVGAVVFNLNTLFALLAMFIAVGADLLIWTPSTIASVLFVEASYLVLLEVTHGGREWSVRDLSMWLALLNLGGSIGFLVSSLFGFFGSPPIEIDQAWTTDFLLLLGCLFFLWGSYLMIPEMLNRDRGDESGEEGDAEPVG